MSRDYHELIDAGNTAQMEKLRAREYKGDYEELEFDELFHLIIDEALELRAEIRRTNVPNIMRLNRIRNEAADVANYAHMVILRAEREAGR